MDIDAAILLHLCTACLLHTLCFSGGCTVTCVLQSFQYMNSNGLVAHSSAHRGECTSSALYTESAVGTAVLMGRIFISHGVVKHTQHHEPQPTLRQAP